MRRCPRNEAVVAAEYRMGGIQKGLLNHGRFERFSGFSPRMTQFIDGAGDRLVDLRVRGRERDAGRRVARCKRQQNGLRAEAVERGGRIEQVLPVLSVGSDMNVDQEPPTQARDPDRGHKVVDSGGRKDCKAHQGKARHCVGCDSAEGPIELHRLKKAEPMLGQRGQLFNARRGIRGFQRCAQISPEIQRDWQPRHRRREVRRVAPQGTWYGVK